MMAAALPEAASGAEPSEAAHADELPLVRGVAAPDDWVCYFWEYEDVEETVRRDTGRQTAANIPSPGIGAPGPW